MAKAVPDDIRTLAPDLPWRSIAGMRDRLIHAYFSVDYDLVWDTVKNEVPVLEERLEILIDQLQAGD